MRTGHACCVWGEDAPLTRLLALAFVLYGLTAVGLLATTMPPFQNADEPNHFLRAGQVADGQLLGQRFPVAVPGGAPVVAAGGWGDAAFQWAAGPFAVLPFHLDQRARLSMWAPEVRWNGPRVLQQFANTASYPPLFYAPAALGVLAGRAADATVVDTLMLSRLFTGLTAVLIGAAAISSAGGGAVWLFAILTLPMSLSLFAACTQDALILATAAFAGALMLRLMRDGGTGQRGRCIGLAAALILLAIARPPYVLLVLLPLALGRVDWRIRLAIVAATVGGCVVWCVINALTTYTNIGLGFGADPGAQLARLWHHPARVVGLATATLSVYGRAYLDEFIGQLGFLDTSLPPAYHRLAWVVLAVAAVAAMLREREAGSTWAARPLIVAGVLLAAAGIFASIYLTWTVVGRPTVDGVQGRYFLPLALAAAAALPALGDRRLAWSRHALVTVVVLFPVVTLAVTMRAVVLRYYLG